jgi:hypothetical protein
MEKTKDGTRRKRKRRRRRRNSVLYIDRHIDGLHIKEKRVNKQVTQKTNKMEKRTKNDFLRFTSGNAFVLINCLGNHDNRSYLKT